MSAVKAERYSAYKDSGVDWLGKVPGHWNFSRIKEIGSVSGRVGWKALKADEYVDEGYIFLATPNIKGKHIDFKNVNYITYERYIESPEIKLMAGDILLTKDGSTLGTTNIVVSLPSETTVNSSIAVIRFKKLGFNKYLFYQILSDYIQNKISLKKSGMGVPHLFQRDINNFILLLPPLPEQTAIAAYLDSKTAQIDRQIDLLSQKATQYGKLKQSLINETITRGLDKTVPMKESGIEWIGEVPDGWGVKRLKDVATMRTGNSLNDTLKEKFSDKTIESTPYVATKDIDLATCCANINNGVYIPNSEFKYKKTPCYSTLLCIEGGSAGKKMAFVKQSVCYVNKLLCFSNNVNVNVDALFFHFFIRTSSFVSKFNTCLTGLKDNYWGVTGPQISRFKFPVPPLEEQQKIANYLNNKTKEIDKITHTINIQIARLKELRKTLINDVVTGKIKVTSEEKTV